MAERVRYKPTGPREVTCKCGLTFTIELGRPGARRKHCDTCRTKSGARFAKPTIDHDGYTQVCISVYGDDLMEWHAKVGRMRELGIRRPSMSELIRRAVEAYEVKA